MHPSSPAGSIGARLKGRYSVEKELGRGGIGVVYLARDEQLHRRPVVVKVLLAHNQTSDWFQKKFRQEIQALALIDHPGVVGALDVGEMPDGSPFLVMQYVDGLTLRARLEKGPLEAAETAHILKQVGGALAAAHEKGIHHRDLKPENIMLQEIGHGERLAKIIDFGIATVREGAAEGTVETQVAGSVPYMAPEQLRGRPEAASDIYALGVLAYEMLTGRVPFRPPSPYELLALQKRGPEARPSELRPGLPPAVDGVIVRALAFEARDRHPSARAFADDLERALRPPERAAARTTVKAADPAAPTVTREAAPAAALELAHVLFLDIVAYSRQPLDRQPSALADLQQLVAKTAEFRRAQAARSLISLPTGDGLALVFFGDPLAPVRCALELAAGVQGLSHLPLRMGVHTGPVYRVADINANLNVAGGGINIAQRVMDSGDAGHILLSAAAADVAGQLSEWSGALRDLGEHPVKHGVRLRLFNLHLRGLGNPRVPSKLRGAAASRKRRLVAGVVALVTAAVVAGLVVRSQRQPATVAPAAASPSLELSYSLTVQKYRNGVPYREPFELGREMLFGPDDRLRLSVTSSADGYLYVVNEGPGAGESPHPAYNMLFPSMVRAGGSARVAAGQRQQVPEVSWLRFDEERGVERLWLVFSTAALPVLEEAKRVANPEEKGELRDARLAAALGALLGSAAPTTRLGPSPGSAAPHTVVRSTGQLLVRLLELEHQ